MLKHTPFYLILLGILSLSVGYNCLQYHKLEIAKQEKIIYKLYIECLYQKIEKLLQKDKDSIEPNYTTHGGEIESITITD